jgi:hypothetical protein
MPATTATPQFKSPTKEVMAETAKTAWVGVLGNLAQVWINFLMEGVLATAEAPTTTKESCMAKASIPQNPSPKYLSMSKGVLGVKAKPAAKIRTIRKKPITNGSGRYFCTSVLQKFVNLFIISTPIILLFS